MPIRYEDLLDMMNIIYPRFFVGVDRKGNELVLLGDKDGFQDGLTIDDKTAFEAFSNHVHIFRGIGIKSKEYAIQIGTLIATHLLDELISKYPQKHFLVYLTVALRDSTIVRFHQKWPGESPWIKKEDKDTYENTTIYIFDSDEQLLE